MLDICIFSRAFYPDIGGLERIAQILAKEATKVGYAVEIVTDTPGISEEDDQQFPFKITRTNEHKDRVLAFKRADVVLFMNVTLHGMRAALAARSKILFSHHGIYWSQSFFGKLLEFVKRQLTRFYTNISVSRFVARNIPAKSVVIYNAYDNSLFQLSAKTVRERDFVFCGRLVSDKGAEVCVRAFAVVLESVPDATMTLVGDGPERQRLEGLIKGMGLDAHVILTGSLVDRTLVNELQRHICMVVPSLWEEPFGIVALEGIACCETVIVARRGGLREAVGECGLVVEPNEEELAAAMLSIALAHRLGVVLPGQPDEEARTAHLALHTPEAVTRQYLKVIEQLISCPAKRFFK